MSEKDIEERLLNHSKAFDSLLNLIPAKLYFSQDNSDQWKKRKQTKEESQAAKRAKLDPDQPVTVKEVEEEKSRRQAARAEKRKKVDDRNLDEEKSQGKLKRHEEKKQAKKQAKKLQGTTEDNESRKQKVTEPSAESTYHPAKRKDGKASLVKLTVRETPNSGRAIIQGDNTKANTLAGSFVQPNSHDAAEVSEEPSQTEPERKSKRAFVEDGDDSSENVVSDDGEAIERIGGFSSNVEHESAAASPAPSNNTDLSNATQKSLAEKLKTSKDPEVQKQLKERLAKRIEELRQARKADGGQAPRNRTELMEQRRKRDELRKERKKHMRIQAQAEAAKGQDQAKDGQTESLNDDNSGSTSSRGKSASANYTFGEVNFDDGDALNPALDSVKASKKNRGPVDVLGAIKHMEAKKTRLANMPDAKRADIEEKDRWSKALKMASGEKLQDDETLLKKSLKRQEKAKKKSEKEWKERNTNVERGKAMRQKKREANIAARKEQKKSGKPGKKAKKVPFKKSKARAGFEGTGFGGAGKKKKGKV